MPSPPRAAGFPDAPTLESFQEKLAYLSAAYQHLHAEKESLREQLSASRIRPNKSLLQLNSPIANVSHNEEVAPTEEEEPQTNDDRFDLNYTEPALISWLPSAHNLMPSRAMNPTRAASRRGPGRRMEQYYRLAKAHAGGLTVDDLVVIGLRFNHSLDDHAFRAAIVRFRSFCTLGPEFIQHDQQTLKSHEDDGTAVPYHVFENLAGKERLGSHQILQDDEPVLQKLQAALVQEDMTYRAACEDSWYNMVEVVVAFAIFLNAIFLGFQINGQTSSLKSLWIYAGELIFTLFFAFEIVLKISRRGMTWFFFWPYLDLECLRRHNCWRGFCGGNIYHFTEDQFGWGVVWEWELSGQLCAVDAFHAHCSGSWSHSPSPLQVPR